VKFRPGARLLKTLSGWKRTVKQFEMGGIFRLESHSVRLQSLCGAALCVAIGHSFTVMINRRASRAAQYGGDPVNMVSGLVLSEALRGGC
jgi:hypothetical protein